MQITKIINGIFCRKCKSLFLVLSLFLFPIFAGHTAPAPQVWTLLGYQGSATTARGHGTSPLDITAINGLASYQFSIFYDPFFFEPDTNIGLNGVTPSPEGFLTSVDISTPGLMVIKGTNPHPTSSLYDAPLNINWISKEPGLAALNYQLDQVTAGDGTAYTITLASNTHLDIRLLKPGDVNNDGKADITDALIIAQSVAGITVSLYYKAAADNNRDKTVNIIDALIAAQYAAGIVRSLPLEAEPPAIPAERAVKLNINFQYDNENCRIGKMQMYVPSGYFEESCEVILEKGALPGFVAVDNYLPFSNPPVLVYFDHWEGDYLNKLKPNLRSADVIMDAEKTLTAVFKSKSME